MNRETGKKARAWKGMRAGYVAKHLWIVKHYGNASFCLFNKSHTIPKVKRFEWANISGSYRRDINDYIPLCPSCHRKMDIGEFCKYGHKFTEKNTRITKQGWRVCRTCQSIWNKDYYKRNVKRN